MLKSGNFNITFNVNIYNINNVEVGNKSIKPSGILPWN